MGSWELLKLRHLANMLQRVFQDHFGRFAAKYDAEKYSWRHSGFTHRMRATPWQLSRCEYTPLPLKG